MLIIGAGASGAIKNPVDEIVAYSLNAPAGCEDAVHVPAAGSVSLERRHRSERQFRIVGGRQERNGPGQGR
jgi:hypothetical protein